ncbi:DNA-directed RNA polymerase subunit beta' [Candidatus Oleimmundimicrobium sp.]|uniref:DNA-directed RNA polymerase subunit beta' n=1 Tax=Candidatus Oleimmundimicrobium sp. TaxID=3060597 RepID=UPI00271F4BFC|nr:DNA-directed RNA polymerase subunit beta' [Candidatus Oleimmundimicrobium sp.]MDO8885948.1 DNA-directed RNA polymerase subunit beta' [Candidatus Oleimmundimicrobium sp.]
MQKSNNFDAIKISLSSPEQIRSWSSGEVKKPETINYRTLKPEKDGLFCEKIFGPTKDWECYCGKYKKVRFKGIICERCGVEVTRSKVRRERMAHIELAAPVAHIWYFKGVPSRMGYMLDISPKDLERVLYFASYIITDVKEEQIKKDLPMFKEELEQEIAEIKEGKLKEIKRLELEKDERLNSPIEEVVKEEGSEEEITKSRPMTKTEIKKIEHNFKNGVKEIEESTEENIAWLKYVFEKLQELKVKQLVPDERLYRDLRIRYGDYISGGMGAEAIYSLLQKMDLAADVEELRKVVKEAKGQKRDRAVKRLKVMSSFLKSSNKPEWMILSTIPVIPPDIRPMVQLDGGRFATSDLNDLYRRVINRNNRLKRLLDLGAPEIIVSNEKRMLQESVDALFDNSRRSRPVTGPGNRPLKSLSDMLKGKQGRFRQNLLGKRVDYSGRSVIVIGPDLKLHQCGLPKIMALELFKPFVMRKLVEKGHAQNIKSAKRMIEKTKPVVWDILEETISAHPVLLNRAPTLHQLGIQAFEPILVEGKAIQVHPMVCTAFNADFDGDQMAVHVPLSPEAQAEARVLMLSANNVLSPAHGRPLATPTQDMVLGCFYLTANRDNCKGEGRVFASSKEAILAYDNGVIDVQAKIKVRMNGKLIDTTVGKVIFNQALPDDYPYVNEELDKKRIANIVADCVDKYDRAQTAQTLDSMKKLGFDYSTKAGLTIGVEDIEVPPNKWEILDAPEKAVEKIERQYRRGLITNEERHQRVVDIWTKATEDVSKAMEENFGKFNPIYMMAKSGARGNLKQIKQLAGMRGLVANPRGDIIDRPIKANFREGLSVLEYFISTHGARKGLADTALRTADSGYLTRRLVDVSQDVIVREEDCGTSQGISVPVLNEEREVYSGLMGRVLLEDLVNPKTKKVIIKAGQGIGKEDAEKIKEAGISTVIGRSVLTCKAEHGICAKCYGWDLSQGKIIDFGTAVGIIAAQSIGEPGTQLTMRTFHTGGVAGEDITHGLPRIVELFEARKPKGQAQIAEISGVVQITETDKFRKVDILSKDGREKSYQISRRFRLKVSDGDKIKAGDQLTEGSLNPHDILDIKGIQAVQMFLVQEVQDVYRSQGVEIHDKHVEVIVRQMLRRVQIVNSGDTEFLSGKLVKCSDFEEENKKVTEMGGESATAKQILLGITKASLATDSFLSAASFQETTRVLTEAAIAGKIDPLLGLKENVIIGKLIPAGTGMSRYRDIEVETKESLVGEKLENIEISLENNL